MFPGADCLFAELSLDNLEAFGDFLVVHRGAVAAQKKFGDIRLPLKPLKAKWCAKISCANSRASIRFLPIDGVQLLVHQVIQAVRNQLKKKENLAPRASKGFSLDQPLWGTKWGTVFRPRVLSPR
jgi:hypothetical protein